MAKDTAHTRQHTHTQLNTPRGHTGEHGPSGPGQRTHNTTQRAATPVNRSKVAQDTAHTQRNSPSEHTREQEPSGPGHRTHNTTHRAGPTVNRSQVARDTAHAAQPRDTTHQAVTQVNRSQVGQDTAQTTQSTEPTQRGTRAKWSGTLRAQHNAPSGHTGEQEPSGPGHRTHNTKHRANRPMNKSQVAHDIAQATQNTERAQW